MTEHLTNPYGEKGERYARTYTGMMSWAGGTPGRTCRECANFKCAGYYAVGGKHKGGMKPSHCRLYIEYMGHKGPGFPHDAEACSKFEENPSPPSINAPVKI